MVAEAPSATSPAASPAGAGKPTAGEGVVAQGGAHVANTMDFSEWTDADKQYSDQQERRIKDFFAADAEAIAKDPAAANAAAADAASRLAAEVKLLPSAGAPDGSLEEAERAAAGEAPPVARTGRVFRVSLGQYYQAPTLEERVPMLGAENVGQMCKTMVVENTKHTGEEDRLNSRYYFVVLQTKEKLNGERVKDFIKAENAKIGRKLGNKKLNFNFCNSFEDLTGFRRNAVCPFASKTDLPVIVSRKLLTVKPGVLFLGGGAPDLKIEISVVDLLRITNPLIGDVF